MIAAPPPALHNDAGTAQPASRPHRLHRLLGRCAAAVAVTGAGLVGLFDQAAHADNCGSLSDCFYTLAAALAVIAGVALVIAVAIALPPPLASLASVGAGGTIALGGAVAIPAAAAEAIAVAQAAAAAAAAAGTILQMSRPSGKERGSDIPSWAKGSRPNAGETPRQAAERVLGEKYGPNYPKGPGSEFNKIKKFFERLLRLGGG